MRLLYPQKLGPQARCLNEGMYMYVALPNSFGIFGYRLDVHMHVLCMQHGYNVQCTHTHEIMH